jgi:hypothetical protein
MNEAVAQGRWGAGRSSADEHRARQVAQGPEKDGDDWTVVFRMGDWAPEEDGPQIVVTGCPMVSTEFGDAGEKMNPATATPSISSIRSGMRTGDSSLAAGRKTPTSTAADGSRRAWPRPLSVDRSP